MTFEGPSNIYGSSLIWRFKRPWGLKLDTFCLLDTLFLNLKTSLTKRRHLVPKREPEFEILSVCYLANQYSCWVILIIFVGIAWMCVSVCKEILWCFAGEQSNTLILFIAAAVNRLQLICAASSVVHWSSYLWRLSIMCLTQSRCLVTDAAKEDQIRVFYW